MYKVNPAHLPDLIDCTDLVGGLTEKAAKELDFLQAAQYRDEIIRLQKELELK